MEGEEKVGELGREDITDLTLKQLLILLKNIKAVIREDRDFWIEVKDDRVYLCWGKEVIV
jgi:hypothetical protein